MDLSGSDDATDFRPFFDMVIGILFVLLILVAAQIYFQQAQDQTAVTDTARREAALRRAEIAAFLGTLAERLRVAGLAAIADPEAGAVVLPLGAVVGIDGAGLPLVEAAPAAALGTTLAGLTACVTRPRSAASDCAGYDRLHLDALGIELRTGTLPPAAALPRDRFGDLAGALLSASLLRGAPGLIGASTDVGGRVVTFGGRLAAEGPAGSGPAGSGPDGDLTLAFTFP